MAETSEIIQHVRRAIAAAAIEMEPFPHFVVRDFLPEATYREILDAWPPEQLSSTTNWASRREIDVAQQLDRFPDHIRPVWRQAVEWTGVARDLVQQKLAPYLRHKFIPLLGFRRAAEINLVTKRIPAPFLASYTGAFSLFPHVDTPLLTTNSYVYVSERDFEEPEFGTVLYQSYGLALPGNRVNLAKPIIDRYLRRAKTVPYARNMLFSYLNTPFAFHGVDPIDMGDRLRRLLMFGTLIAAEQTFTDDEARRLVS